MQRYTCHKEVEAAAIFEIAYAPSGDIIIYHGTNEDATTVEASFFSRGHASVGDYLVRYEDGYLSWSPKAVFESGYTLKEA